MDHMNTADVQTDPVALVRSLDADQIARRLEELAAEERALRVLLRSARARQQGQLRRERREGVTRGR
jgi:hypothetical protein